MPRKSEPEQELKPYVEKGNIEAHIIADMLRIESITTELREFKEDTKSRFDKPCPISKGKLEKQL